ncbi:antitoxin [Sphingomonas sp.]|uniref:antitoxin n=1 Tax=Sphingomonas sp. TaxID=28214 RepID=UPI002E347E38|nr:AbrB/MazE/SpoVT family DNA-binding domain-containing protein [Sphingomonas sp.]HEX4693171.1 AbrB/MazE/SpoVT family DNA-binding domain-containing protein [Sphingomonas sp.]
MAVHQTKTFKSGNSVAVRLPKGFGFAPGTPVTIQRNGDALTIRPANDPAEARRKLRQLVADLRAIGRAGEIQGRDEVGIEFPDRPGLY